MRERIRVHYEPVEKGHLELFDVYQDEQHIGQFFSFRSLPGVLGIPQGTLEGRYARRRLFTVKRDIHTGNSRPIRAFPIERWQEVYAVLTGPSGARFETDIERREREVTRTVGVPLEFRTVAGQQYVTLRALADYYGKSLTTIRTRLDVAGLLRHARDVHLTPTLQGGRATKCFPADMLDKVKAAIEERATFHNEFEQAAHAVRHPPRVAFDGVLPRAPSIATGEPDADAGTGGLAQQLEDMLRGTVLPPPLYRSISEEMAGQAPNHATSEWADKLHAARDKVWEFDAVIDEMRQAGLSDDDVHQAMVLADSAPAGKERSAGGAA